MTGPFNTQLDAGDDDEFLVFGCYNNAQMLLFMGITLYRIFGIGMTVGFAFGIIDGTAIEDFMDFLCGNMAAIHPAARVFGENQLPVPVEWHPLRHGWSGRVIPGTGNG